MHQPSGLKTVFFGTPEFASTILEHLLEVGEKIVAVVTTPAKPRGRGLKLHASAVQEVAERHGIPVIAPFKLRDPELVDQLCTFEADCFCIVAYKILPKEIFTLPKLGSFNIHASLLPKYRGAAPINWAIIRGEKETGVTTFFLEEKVDTGQMLLTARLAIGENETAGELHDRLMLLGASIAAETLNGIASGSLIPTKQPDGLATSAPKIFPKDSVINFDLPSFEVHNFIRGLSPHPGAMTEVGGVKLKLLRSRRELEVFSGLPSGEFRISDEGKRLFVGTQDLPLELLQIQREGRSVLPTEEFLRGARGIFSA